MDGQFNFTLQKTAKWAHILAIVTFVSLGISLINSILVIITTGEFGVILSAIITTVISFILAMCIYNFSKHAKIASETNDSAQLNQAMYQIKNYFLIMGILFIIGLSLVALGLFIAIIIV